jgi:hypothetical protein
VCIIFITMSVSKYIGTAMTFVSVVFTIFMNVLELLVALFRHSCLQCSRRCS